MIFNKYQSILSLNSDKNEWSIRVRAQTIWKGINRKTNEFRGYNIIFIDDQNCRIHAYISEKIADGFSKYLEEGHLYTVSNFKVKHYQGDETNRALRNAIHIYFDIQTKLEPFKEVDCNIEPYAFDLFGLGDAEKFVTDNRFLIDVIGVVDTANPTCFVSKEDKNKSHIKFKITDGRHRVNVTFFNEVAANFEKAFKDIAEEQVVIIIACAKVNKYDGEIGITNYPATRFYLNPKHYSVKEFLNRVTLLELEEENDEKIYTVEEVKKFTEVKISKNVKCQLNVKKVEDKNNWYDNICSTCEQEVNIVDGRYRCLNCQRNIPFPEKRFRLCTVCKDTTGILPIVFPDDEIQRLTGKTVFEVENDDNQVGEGIMFPPLLKDFEKKDYIITLNISESNIKKACNVYLATSICEVPEKVGDHTPGEQLSPLNPEITMNAESEISELKNKCSPSTEKSTNRTKVRKSNMSVKCELDETTLIAKCMKL